MINKLIIFLLRIKFGLKKDDWFRFGNQRIYNNDVYRFEDGKLRKKVNYYPHGYSMQDSSIAFNFLLSDDCKVVKVKEK